MNIIKIIFGRFILILFRLFKINSKKIFFINFNGKSYGESPAYISDYIIKNNYNYEIIWAFRKPENENISPLIKKIRINSLSYFYELATSKIIINDVRFPYYFVKRKGQFYIQTWHSSLRLKKIEKDAVNFLSKDYIKSAKNDSKMIDLITCGSEFSKNTFQNSFWYNGNVLMTGTPKFDIYFDKILMQNRKKEILKKYKINNEKKIFLYAPTYRNIKNSVELIDFDEFSNFLKERKIVLFVRLHPNSNEVIPSNDNLINVSEYPNIQDLIVACDLLITDYSGCCFDALIIKKPCVLYVPDMENYKKKERSLYFDFSELPFDKINNKRDLYKYIEKSKNLNYLKKYEKFSNKVGLKENGKASEKVVRIIEGVIENEKI